MLAGNGRVELTRITQVVPAWFYKVSKGLLCCLDWEVPGTIHVEPISPAMFKLCESPCGFLYKRSPIVNASNVLKCHGWPRKLEVVQNLKYFLLILFSGGRLFDPSGCNKILWMDNTLDVFLCAILKLVQISAF